MIAIIYHNFRITFFLLFFSLTLWSCSENNDNSNNFNKAKQTIESRDSLYKWLSVNSNYLNKNYYRKVFFGNYQNAIKQQDYLNAQILLIKYGELLYNNYEFDSTYHITLKDFLRSKLTEKQDTNTASLYFYCGYQYQVNRQMDSCGYWNTKALKSCHLPEYENIFMKAKNQQGLIYTRFSQPDSAIKTFMEIIPIAEKKKIYAKLGSLYNNIGYCYEMLDAKKESEKMYEKSATNFLLAKDTTDYFSLKTTYANNQFSYKHDTLLTIRLIDSSLRVFNNFKNATGLDSCNAHYILALKYFLLKKHDKALYHIRKSSDYFIRTNNFNLLPYNQFLETSILFGRNKKLNNKREVEKLAQKLADEKTYFEALDLYNLLSEDAVAESNYQDALNFRNKAISLNDSLIIKNQKGQLFEFEKKYETEKKEQLIKIQATELKQKNTFIYALIVSLIGLLLISLAYYLWQKQKTLKQDKTNNMNFTKQLLENTEDERKRIASDLHDSISHELLNLKFIFKQDFATVNTKIDSIINDIRGISRNLHPVMFDKIGLESNLEQLIKRIQEQNDFMISTEINYEGSLSAADELQIYRIFQEALTNIIKYAKAHAGKITMRENKSTIFIEIKDNGKGFNVKEALNSGKSFGLHNIIERSRIIGGEAHIQSSSEGTIINITIPKKS